MTAPSLAFTLYLYATLITFALFFGLILSLECLKREWRWQGIMGQMLNSLVGTLIH